MFSAFTRTLAGGAAIAGLVASGLVVPSAAGAAGTLTLDPSSGNGAYATISATTSGGCANANATHYQVTLTGSGLAAPINMVGLTPLKSIGASGAASDPMSTPLSKSFDDVKDDNGGSLPSGNYTLTFTCRAQISPAAINTFTTPIAISSIPGGLTWRVGLAPVEEPMVNVTKPKVKGKKQVGKTLRANAGTWEAKPDRVTYRWKLGKKTISKKARVTVPKNAKGKRLRLIVTATKDGYTPGKVTVRVRIK